MLGLALACASDPLPAGVYRSGPNAVVRGERTGTVRVWGPQGTVQRVASPGPEGTTLLGEAGPVWIVEGEVPAPTKASPVSAALVESVGFHLGPLVGAKPTGAPDAARSSGVWVRSTVKLRQELSPPIYVASATRDVSGKGDDRTGENCVAVVATIDAKATTVLSSHALSGARQSCAVPVVVPPVDRDGDGVLDVMVHGQNGNRGFRAWFRLVDGKLEAGPADAWEGIP